MFRPLGLGKDDGTLKEKDPPLVFVVSLVDHQISLSQDLALIMEVPLETFQTLDGQHVVAVSKDEVDHFVCFLEREENRGESEHV